jgi:NAD(P)-dependent dehydrogenase (short-subunit alcohol dehydrogenase family)
MPSCASISTPFSTSPGHSSTACSTRGWGRIVNIASINGSKGQFGQTNYSAAKAGMHGFTKALAQEVARKGVTVNTVSPGYLDTKMVTSMSEEVVKQVIAGIPGGSSRDGLRKSLHWLHSSSVNLRGS